MKDKEFKRLLDEDPGDPVFAEYAEILRGKKQLDEALFVCLAGLSKNPSFHRGRLVLARVFYQKDYLTFAVREVEQLVSELPTNQSLRKLLAALSPSSGSPSVEAVESEPEQSDESTLAEADFDFEILEEIEADED